MTQNTAQEHPTSITREVDVIIIGAGTAGLNAVGQVRRHTKNFLLVDGHEEMGTTCARVGCMPSKALIHIADEFESRNQFKRKGIQGSEGLSIDGEQVMERVQDIRDILVDRVLSNSVDKMGDKFINEYAEFVAPDTLKVGEDIIKAKAIIIAVGSRPVLPAPWRALGDQVMTTDELFEQEELPKSLAVVGLGVIGLELGQAFSRLGVDVTGIDALDTVAGLSDPEIRKQAIHQVEKNMPLWLNNKAELSAAGDLIQIDAGEQRIEVERVLVSVGRRSNIDKLGLEGLGIELDNNGLPPFNANTMQVADLPVFLAGDANQDRAILHEAGLEGRISGHNALRTGLGETPVPFRRNTPLHITFTDPNICQVGATYDELDLDHTVIGDFPMGPHGRALTMGNNHGLVRIYAQKSDGKLLGAAMVAPRGENLAHLLNWSIEDGATAFDLLKKPFYHPVFEEAVQSALRSVISQLENQPGYPPELQPL